LADRTLAGAFPPRQDGSGPRGNLDAAKRRSRAAAITAVLFEEVASRICKLRRANRRVEADAETMEPTPMPLFLPLVPLAPFLIVGTPRRCRRA
jgi:hypothetical protein